MDASSFVWVDICPDAVFDELFLKVFLLEEGLVVALKLDAYLVFRRFYSYSCAFHGRC